MNITINTRLLVRILLISLLVLLLLNIFVLLLAYSGVYHGPLMYELFHKFNFNGKYNIPSFFNTFLLLIASLILYYIYLVQKKRFFLQRRWFALAILFLIMAIEENASVHIFLHSLLPRQSILMQTGLSVLLWAIPFGILVTVLAIYFKRLVLSLPREIAKGFAISAVIYITGAIVLDLVASVISHLKGSRSLAYTAVSTLEESLEMLGIIVFIHYLFAYIKAEFNTIGISFGGEG